MGTHTIKVTGVSDGLLELLDRRIRERHATGRAEYIRELIRKDVLGQDASPRRLRDGLAPIHQEARERGYTAGEIEEFVREAVAARRREARTGRDRLER